MPDSYSDARAPIYLIESPSPEDLYKGRNEGQSLVNILALGEIEVNYFFVSDENHFKLALHDISVLISKRDDKDAVLPFIHISAHASEDGIELTDGDCIYWEKLLLLLEELHGKVGEWSESSGSTSLPRCSLSLSSCSAFMNFTAATKPNMPVQAVIGPNEDVGWCQSLLAFSSFYYQAFVSQQSFSKSVLAMNAATCSNNSTVFSLKLTDGLQSLAVGATATAVALRFPASDVTGHSAARKLDVGALPEPGRHLR